MDAIRANTALMKSRCGTPVMAVVKADGFGLGSARVARAALAGGATELGVATCNEALGLRADGLDVPILAWVIHEGAPLREAVSAGIRLGLTTPAQVVEIARIAAGLGRPAEIELEVETGMHRSGCPESDWPALFEAARTAEEAGHVRVIGVWTHLAGTAPEQFTAPLANLGRAVALARTYGLRPRQHAAASVAASIDPRARLDIVRLGASLFGIEPDRSHPVGLVPTARWESQIIQLRDVPAGARVGYGRDEVREPTRLALIPVGYADGLSRHASPGLGVRIADGSVVPFFGRISMDQSIVDVSGHDVAPGDPVVLIGDSRRGEPDLVACADALDTIEQEVLTGLGPRVARIEEVLT